MVGYIICSTNFISVKTMNSLIDLHCQTLGTPNLLLLNPIFRKRRKRASSLGRMCVTGRRKHVRPCKVHIFLISATNRSIQPFLGDHKSYRLQPFPPVCLSCPDNVSRRPQELQTSNFACSLYRYLTVPPVPPKRLPSGCLKINFKLET